MSRPTTPKPAPVKPSPHGLHYPIRPKQRDVETPRPPWALHSDPLPRERVDLSYKPPPFALHDPENSERKCYTPPTRYILKKEVPARPHSATAVRERKQGPKPRYGGSYLKSPIVITPSTQDEKNDFNVLNEFALHPEKRARNLTKAYAQKPTFIRKWLAQEQKEIETSQLKLAYDRRNLPLTVAQAGLNKTLKWNVPFEQIDYAVVLPLVFHGLKDTQEPYMFISKQAIADLLGNCDHAVSVIKPVIPELFRPIRYALSQSKSPQIVAAGMRAMQALLRSHEELQPAAVKLCISMLTLLNKYLNMNDNTGDSMDYGERNRVCLGDEAQATLRMMEVIGGPATLRRIRAIIPTYQSQNM